MAPERERFLIFNPMFCPLCGGHRVFLCPDSRGRENKVLHACFQMPRMGEIMDGALTWR